MGSKPSLNHQIKKYSSNNILVLCKSNSFDVARIGVAIRKKDINAALNILKFSNKRVSKEVLKTLNSAVANAENNNNLDIDKLFVKEAYVGKSLRMKRFRPMSKGRAFQIIKPFSRLTLVLEERL